MQKTTIIKGYVENLSKEYLRQELHFNFYYMVSSVLICACIGLLLGSEHIIREIRKEGMWKINLPKLILVGIPSLYFGLIYIWIYIGSQFSQNIKIYPGIHLMRYVLDSVPFFQVILGYVVITSFYKYSEKVDL